MIFRRAQRPSGPPAQLGGTIGPPVPQPSLTAAPSSDGAGDRYPMMPTDVDVAAPNWSPADEPRLWRKLVRVAAKITFADTLVAAWYCAMDPATPMRVQGALLAALAYFVLPIDAVPDFLAGIGFTDD